MVDGKRSLDGFAGGDGRRGSLVAEGTDDLMGASVVHQLGDARFTERVAAADDARGANAVDFEGVVAQRAFERGVLAGLLDDGAKVGEPLRVHGVDFVADVGGSELAGGEGGLRIVF